VEKAAVFDGPAARVALPGDQRRYPNMPAILMAKAVDRRLREVEFGEHGLSVQTGWMCRCKAIANCGACRRGRHTLLFKIGTPGRHFDD